MKYILMMHAPRGNGEYQISDWSPDDFRAHIQFMKDLNRDLIQSGEFVSAEGLTPPGQARIVRADAKGAPVVTDGPFAEAKELIAGFAILDVKSKDEAIEHASRFAKIVGATQVDVRLVAEF